MTFLQLPYRTKTWIEKSLNCRITSLRLLLVLCSNQFSWKNFAKLCCSIPRNAFCVFPYYISNNFNSLIFEKCFLLNVANLQLFDTAIDAMNTSRNSTRLPDFSRLLKIWLDFIAEFSSNGITASLKLLNFSIIRLVLSEL